MEGTDGSGLKPSADAARPRIFWLVLQGDRMQVSRLKPPDDVFRPPYEVIPLIEVMDGSFK